MSLSSDYFEDDPEFEKALAELPLPEDDNIATIRRSEPATDEGSPQSAQSDGMPPSTQPCLKRRRTYESDDEDEGLRITKHSVLTSVDQDVAKSAYMASHTYGASCFGNFGEYMQRKRQKLQIQNAEIDDDRLDIQASPSRIFQGLEIYINGWTEPSVQELRQLIIKHGGIYHAYLDKKSLVTHVITCSLTPAKIREFKHMKVATPDWLVKSAEADILLSWHDFRYEPTEKAEEAQGRKAAQKSLFDGFMTQQSARPSSSAGINPKAQKLRLTVDLPQTQPVPGPFTPTLPGTSNTKSPISPASAGPVVDPSTPKKPSQSLATPVRPLCSVGPVSPGQATKVPGYASDESNFAAQRAMADPAWRAAHTSVAPDFIEGYYRNSRLHHLSTWKAELRNLVAEAQERAESAATSSSQKIGTIGGSHDGDAVTKVVQENMDGKNWAHSGQDDDISMKGARLVKREKGKGKAPNARASEDRIIMHCDFDSFFVSAGLVDRPHLRGKPIVVCHSQGAQGRQSSTSEIASVSYEARKFGIKSGMSLQQARKLCPTIMTIPYEFQRYKHFSLQFYTILMAHADDLQAVSVDEALIDVTSSVFRIKTEISLSQGQASSDDNTEGDYAKDFAEAIRAQVKTTTGCEVSIGIAHNIMLARLASRRAKPAGSFHLRPADVSSIMDTLDIDDLHGFGYAAHQKAQEKLGTASLRELAKMSKAILCDALGKGTGETLYNAMRGIDHRKLESDKPRRSVSCDINYGIRFENNEQAEAFIYQLSEEVARRLDAISMCGRSLTLKVMKRDPSAPVEAAKFMGHGICETFSKQTSLIAPGGRATSDFKIIGEHAWRLLKAFNFDPSELRGIAVQVQKLERVGADGSGIDSGQAILPFKPVISPPKQTIEKNAVFESLKSDLKEDKGLGPSAVDVVVKTRQSAKGKQTSILAPDPISAAPRAESVVPDLPNFSQVDKTVFEALPVDVRNELEAEYKRRSVTPALGEDAKDDANHGGLRARSLSVSRQVFPPLKRRIVVKGTSNMNVKHITRQLAPKSRAGLSPTKATLFNKKQSVISSSITNSVKLRVTEEELRKLDIDPEVFSVLPADLQREQLALAKHKHAPVKGAISYSSQRKIIKPRKHTRIRGTPGIVIPPPPPPKAKFPDPPTLKQRGKAKGEKLYFTEADDVQDVVEKWFNAFRMKAPNSKDVEFFETWLVKCVDGSISTDNGVEKAVKVMKWWRTLLRREYGEMEDVVGSRAERQADDDLRTSESWWQVFRDVKASMDIVARKRFGGSLSLR